MKTIPTLAATTTVSLLIMLTVDYMLAEKAEFLNAWSVIERLFGRTPSAGDSAVFQQLGFVGELIAILGINLVIGFILTVLFQRWKENRTKAI